MAGEPANGHAKALALDEEKMRAAALDDFFLAARAAMAEPSADFLNRVLADAGEVSTARTPAAPAPRRRATGAGRPGAWRAIALLLGGWRGGAALTACALLGFAIGASGFANLSADLGADQTTTASAAETVGDFYDLAALE